MTDTAPARAAEDAARESYGKLLAILAARSQDIAAAEDALADAFALALDRWPVDGVPDRPEAWLLTVARRRRIDNARKTARLNYTDTPPEPSMFDLETDPDALPDDRLKLMFVCAHPAIDPGMRTPLMLQTVLGVEAKDIAKLYLLPASTLAQRLVRVKRKIKENRLPFALPDRTDMPQRIEAVLEAVYGAYSLDWQSGPGALSHEALFLATILADLMPEEGEALGLAALIALVEARRAARVVDGMYVPLPEQDTQLWDAGLVRRGTRLLTQAADLGRIGRFQIEAAIQSVYAERLSGHDIDWRALSQLHMALRRLHPTLGTAVAQAAAVGEDSGPTEGLRLLDLIDADALRGFQPAWAVRAHLKAKTGDLDGALQAYERAIALCTDLPSRHWLEAQRDALPVTRH